MLLFLAKYGRPHDVLTAVDAARKKARSDSFLARQTVAVAARGAGLNYAKVKRTWVQEVSRGAADSASVAVSLLGFLSGTFPATSSGTHLYLFPKKATGPYPLAKFLILCAIAGSERERKATSPRPVIEQFVADPWMIAALREIHPAWFR
jgi:hypothetical protein